jgi:hypothetical protein
VDGGLFLVEQYAMINNMDERKQVVFAGSLLRDAALQWWMAQQGLIGG